MSLLGQLLKHQCCFCGQSIALTRVEPVVLLLTRDDGESQDLFCHLARLRACLDPDIPLLPELDNDAPAV